MKREEHKPRFRDDGTMHATIIDEYGNQFRIHIRKVLLKKKHKVRKIGGAKVERPHEKYYAWINGQNPPLILDEVAGRFLVNFIKGIWKCHDEGTTGKDIVPKKIEEYVVQKMYRLYGNRFKIGEKRVTLNRIRQDYQRVLNTFFDIARGECPAIAGNGVEEISYLDWNAPARMDLAVTYRCNLHCGKCYNGEERKSSELNFNEWLEVYEILWKIGIPQIVFTGGEPLIRDDIVQLISAADEFTTGLITNGTLLADKAEELVAASLDFCQVTIESAEPKIHDKMTGVSGSWEKTVAGIKAAVRAGLSVSTNTTLTKSNAYGFLSLMEFLVNECGVKSIGCNSLICAGSGIGCKIKNGVTDAEISEILRNSKMKAARMGVQFNWYSPTCYNKGINPIDMGFGVKACSAAAHNMLIAPDGRVYPCQSYPDSVGNIRDNPWDEIWNHPICKNLRERKMYPVACGSCEYFSACGGGCPLDKSERIQGE